MKKILIVKVFATLAIGILCFTQTSAQEHYYYYKGKKIYLELNPDYVFISSTSENNIQNARINATIDNSNSTEITEDRAGQTLVKPKGLDKQTPVRYWKEIKLTDNLSKTRYSEQIQQLKADNNDLIVSPYFRSKSTDKIGLSNYFQVRLKHQDDIKVLLEQIAIFNVELVGYNKFMPLWFTLSIKPNTLNAMKMANLFYETGLFQYAEPDLMIDVSPASVQSISGITFSPNDPFYSDQWHLNNTGQNDGISGIDINAEDAWNVTLGSSNITVAVLDHGFEMDHPDLINNTVEDGYDTNTQTSPSIVRGRHGTPCAGLIGAEGNNNEGIIGVAPNTGLMSISNSLVGSPLSRSLRAGGINWAVNEGADIISNSWSAGDLPITELDEAITNALTNGRNGLGTVVVFSSGNSNVDGAQYPSNSNPDILCVGAIDRCGIRSGRTDIVSESCEPWCSSCSPGSSFGAPLDVVAGGTSIPTTDRQDDEGYNITGNGNYTNLDYHNSFGGTSAACPIVAGVAALVLSVNPNLTVKEVNDIIEQSAQKLGDYSFSATLGRPNGTWNNEVGYGLVDAHTAVLLAQATSGCSDSQTFETQIKGKYHDAEERITDGWMYRTSNDLEFGQDYSMKQYLGLRFKDINIPQGAQICNAYIEFTAKGTTNSDFTIEIMGQDSDDAYAFQSYNHDISGRIQNRTGAGVDWNFGSVTWTTNQIVQSPNVASIVQEVVNRSGWHSGNDLAFLFKTQSGMGTRRVYTYDGSRTKCAKLIIEYGNDPDSMDKTAHGSDNTANKSTSYQRQLAVNIFEESVNINNYPNPFTGQTTIEFTLEKDVPVTLYVSDITGKQIAVLLDNEQSTKGTHQTIFDGKNYPAGMYYYTMQAGDYVATKKMTLIK